MNEHTLPEITDKRIVLQKNEFPKRKIDVFEAALPLLVNLASNTLYDKSLKAGLKETLGDINTGSQWLRYWWNIGISGPIWFHRLNNFADSLSYKLLYHTAYKNKHGRLPPEGKRVIRERPNVFGSDTYSDSFEPMIPEKKIIFRKSPRNNYVKKTSPSKRNLFVSKK